jgi:hypothetical protein
MAIRPRPGKRGTMDGGAIAIAPYGRGTSPRVRRIPCRGTCNQTQIKSVTGDGFGFAKNKR